MSLKKNVDHFGQMYENLQRSIKWTNQNLPFGHKDNFKYIELREYIHTYPCKPMKDYINEMNRLQIPVEVLINY